MRIHEHGTELYVDVDGPQLRGDGDRLAERPTILVLHGGPGFDQGYLRPGLGALRSDARLVFVDLRGQGRSGRPPVETCTLEQMADDVAALCAQLGLGAPVVFGHSAGGFVALHLALRHPGQVGGLILCNTSPTLAPLPDDDPPPSLVERTSPATVETAARLFGGDFSPETVDAFNRLVLPYYAGPQHMDVPGRLMSLSGFSADVAAYFFGVLAPGYDLRPHLKDVSARTLVITGHYDWVCPPVVSRILTTQIPGAVLTEPERRTLHLLRGPGQLPRRRAGLPQPARRAHAGRRPPHDRYGSARGARSATSSSGAGRHRSVERRALASIHR
jgi:proline iminopeptidase